VKVKTLGVDKIDCGFKAASHHTGLPSAGSDRPDLLNHSWYPAGPYILVRNKTFLSLGRNRAIVITVDSTFCVLKLLAVSCDEMKTSTNGWRELVSRDVWQWSLWFWVYDPENLDFSAKDLWTRCQEKSGAKILRFCKTLDRLQESRRSTKFACSWQHVKCWNKFGAKRRSIQATNCCAECDKSNLKIQVSATKCSAHSQRVFERFVRSMGVFEWIFSDKTASSCYDLRMHITVVTSHCASGI